MSKHTATPWETDGLTIKAAPGFFCETRMVLATLGHHVPAPEREANARLMAEAPELLALALRLEPWLAGHEHQEKARGERQHDNQFLTDLRAAIARATGDAPVTASAAHRPACWRCKGSGDMEVTAGNGPDAYTETTVCTQCGGTGEEQ